MISCNAIYRLGILATLKIHFFKHLETTNLNQPYSGLFKLQNRKYIELSFG